MQRPARRQLQSKESNAPDIKAPRSDIHSASCAGLTLARAKDVRGSQPGILEKIPPVEQAARATLVAHKFVMRPVRSGGVQKHPDSHLHALKVELSVSGIKNRVYRDAKLILLISQIATIATNPALAKAADTAAALNKITPSA